MKVSVANIMNVPLFKAFAKVKIVFSSTSATILTKKIAHKFTAATINK
jgi:hypothetical protein